LRPKIGNWVFGCDICQQVCPWNLRFAQQEDLIPGDMSFEQPDLIAELSLSPQEFNKRFKDTPVKRAKRRGYLRNVTVALGNSGSTSGIPRLIQSLNEDREPLVRSHAAWALGRMGDEQARRGLEKALLREEDPSVREEISYSLESEC
jgi:epoxyqueuosine reductase